MNSADWKKVLKSNKYFSKAERNNVIIGYMPVLTTLFAFEDSKQLIFDSSNEEVIVMLKKLRGLHMRLNTSKKVYWFCLHDTVRMLDN